MGVETLKSYPIIMSHLRRKIAAKRRIKVGNGLPDTLTYNDVEQVVGDALKIIDKNLPSLKGQFTKNSLKDDMIKTGIASDIGIRSNELNLKPTEIVEPKMKSPNPNIKEEPIVEEPVAVEETVINTPDEVVTEESITEPVMESPIPEEVTETVVTETPKLSSEEMNVAQEVGNMASDIANAFKPLTPIVAPMPTTGTPMVNRTKVNNSPQIGTAKIWNDDLKFW
jgi:hypothetical protein